MTSSNTPPSPLSLSAPAPLAGEVRVPGDKSISHRAIMLSALAVGRSEVRGLLEGEDVLATAAAMRAMGAQVERLGQGHWVVDGVGVGGLLQPDAQLDMGNSGTSTRLLMGLVSSHPITATFVGDASLSRRPMGRVIEPLSRIGAEITASPDGRLPLMLRGADTPLPIHYRLPVASAQVKSAILLAGLNIGAETVVEEPVPTRDHSERMLKGFGAELSVEPMADGGKRIAVRGWAELKPQTLEVPGDPSSAGFLLVAALIVPGSNITIHGVGLNPTRDGLVRVLQEMGADITKLNEREVGGEPVADLLVTHSALTGIEVPPEVAPSMIDEYPILFVAAALASGRTVMRGIEELRVKESDRIAAMAAGLRAAGVAVEELPDGLIVEGSGGEKVAGGCTVATHLDHRIAMSFAVLSLAAKTAITVDDRAPIATSFPDFLPLMQRLGAVQA
ncbi:3-phosphoshikimate 1-carboxyvinyltransferase [Sandaracinobacter neustonicus]|uniref:3-phosphoshikimate 1-carboxyvinyltransferase n=1 Tax=Sandaracinobacter neustonicus TaxID=1715348 RepID=A0A501XLH4_9SPHN|nr:3-phosphoshikimate 1-carboxyvinyltransferase [Sandaracinobacter neustonicus]TPE61124.1 3-phosphoshikimate 1-carboxyvinyltransferase [Sandaracinobacter neustonicus]